MKKKIRVMGIWAAAVIGLSGCGTMTNQAEEDSTSSQKEEVSAEPEREEDVPKTSTEPEHEEDVRETSTESEHEEDVREASTEPAHEEDVREASTEPESEQFENWREAYQVFLDDWKQVEKYGDFSYLPMYFEDRYSFDQYFLCDIDGNGTPELFLYSTCMRLTAVFTYTNEPVFLLYTNIYGINPETDEVVIQGHWHGAGGSGIDEWTAYSISGDKAEYSMYIDFIDAGEYDEEIRYTVYDRETEEYTHPQDSTEYDAFYAAHVKPCILAEEYLLYELSDPSGFDYIQ